MRALDDLDSTGARSTTAHEWAFSRADFNRIRRMIHGYAGIDLAESKYEMAYSRVARRLRATGALSFRAYLDSLEAGKGPEWEQFANALTTNLTSFFREAHHFPMLADQLRAVAERGPARIWCAAASTGEEPYSLAMTACETFATWTPPVTILATDIDTEVLAHGRQGVYGRDRVESLSPERLRRFFLRGKGVQEGKVRVRPELAQLIQFRPLNLLDSNWGPMQPFDAIFCRNVMIYFDKPTQLRVLTRLEPLLTPDGRLYAGHSENFFHAQQLIRPCGRTVYRKAAP
ncbi:CheR family methyltransferase [Variovorax sp. VNK109]|uniref:CheR family methyltransferase n=1 Tax=Variovorax sp. VNK109 TaxID=3400919 RepID=UPI003C0E7A29